MIYIGIGSAARVGKDSLGKFLIEKFASHGISAKRFALADSLKEKLDPFIQQEFGFSSFTENDNEKSIIRPILVAFGGAKRNETKGAFWTQILEDRINKDSQCEVAIITDLRYAELGPMDEAFWLKRKGGKLIHVTRLEGGKPLRYVNDDEARNDVVVKEMADFKLEWSSFIDNPDELKKVDDLFEKLRSSLCE